VINLGQIIRQYGQAYIEQYRPPKTHLKVLSAIQNCRTAALGGHAWVCQACACLHVRYNSCRNRHCPNCQAFEKEKWIEHRKEELIPVPYLHIVFTLPHQLNSLTISNDRLIYQLLFKAAWQTLQTISEDKKWLGAQMGMIAVLHTWGSNLSLHPHLHCIVPAGGWDNEKQKWRATKNKRFLAPNKKVLSPVFKGIFMRLLIEAIEEGQVHFYGQAKMYEDMEQLRNLLQQLYKLNWVVYAKRPFAGPIQIIKYLSRYTHRIAISNHRIVALKDDKITFTVKNYRKLDKKGQPLKTTLTIGVLEFLRRFLMHVLPFRFVRIRYYGILSIRNRKTKLLQIQKHLGHQRPPRSVLTTQQRLQQLGIDPNQCPYCQQSTLTFLGYIPQTYLPPNKSPPLDILVVPDTERMNNTQA